MESCLLLVLKVNLFHKLPTENEVSKIESILTWGSLLVDCLFGNGLQDRPLSTMYEEIIELNNAFRVSCSHCNASCFSFSKSLAHLIFSLKLNCLYI